MPTGYVRKLAQKHHTSVGKSEKEWSKAKAVAKKEGKGENFAYITSIYKKMMGESAKSLSLIDFLTVTESSEVGDISYSSRDDYDKEDEFSDDEGLDDEFSDNEDLEDEDEFDDEFSDDEGLDDENEFSEDDLEGHDGHQLADIVSDDELSDTEDQDEFDDEDEFDDQEGDDLEDEDEFSDNEEFPEDEDEFGNNEMPSRDKFREGYETKGSFLQELMVITEKKKPLKKAAKAVYHRDYVRTKKKLYRKYHPENRSQEQNQ